jgi:hypothetical protein
LAVVALLVVARPFQYVLSPAHMSPTLGILFHVLHILYSFTFVTQPQIRTFRISVALSAPLITALLSQLPWALRVPLIKPITVSAAIIVVALLLAHTYTSTMFERLGTPLACFSNSLITTSSLWLTLLIFIRLVSSIKLKTHYY